MARFRNFGEFFFGGKKDYGRRKVSFKGQERSIGFKEKIVIKIHQLDI